MTPMKTVMALSLTALALGGCVDPNAYPNEPTARQTNGMIVGGMLGAMAGVTSEGEGKLGRAAAGGVLGAVIGGAIGYSLDQQAAELRGSFQNPNVTVTNYGDYLVVNMPQDLLFASGSATLVPTLIQDLRTVANSLVRYPSSRIEVIGHTDNIGTAAFNQDLSQRRAWSVASVLRDTGVPNARLSAFGRGEDQPIASNLTPQGQAQNRRVEIIIRPQN
jgi:outer membrane protein OmpA-like peptidoglycan-associated protein